MTGQLGSDAERLLAIQELDRAIAGKSPELHAASGRLQAARARSTECLRAVEAVERRVRAIDEQVHREGGAVFLDGGASLDRGKVRLGNEALRYAGWRGRIDIPLASVQRTELGTSDLPPRAGIPVLSRFWPGEPRRAGALMILFDADGAEHRATFADLPDAADWAAGVEAQRQCLGDVAAARAALSTEVAAARAPLREAMAEAATAEQRLRLVQSEIAALSSKKASLEAQQRAVDAARARVLKDAQQAARKGRR